MNRGTVESLGLDPGVDTTAMYIGRAEGDATTNTAMLTGGIYNGGSIRAVATTGNANATEEDPRDANAHAIVVAAGGIFLRS